MSNNGQANYAHLSDSDMVAALKSLYRVAPGECLITKLHEEYKKAMKDLDFDFRTINEILQECLVAPNPLLSFAAWYSTWLNGNVKFAQMYSVEENKLGIGITLFAIRPFRVQLFLFKPGAVIPPHSHPDVESYELYVAGDMDLTKKEQDGNMVVQNKREFVKPDKNGICESNGGMIRVPAGCVHGGRINNHGNLSDRGGCFISIQYWRNRWEDASVIANWKGVDGARHL